MVDPIKAMFDARNIAAKQGKPLLHRRHPRSEVGNTLKYAIELRIRALKIFPNKIYALSGHPRKLSPVATICNAFGTGDSASEYAKRSFETASFGRNCQPLDCNGARGED